MKKHIKIFTVKFRGGAANYLAALLEQTEGR